MPNNLSHGEQPLWCLLYFVFVYRSWGQTLARRWVWRVIPLHLSINLETISSVPLQNVKASLSRRWVHHHFFLGLSLEFPSQHINPSCAIIFFCPALPFSHWGGWGYGHEWICLSGLCSLQYAKKKLCLKMTGCGRLLSPSLTSLCMGYDGCLPKISYLIGSETFKGMTLPQLPSLSLWQEDSLALT